MGNAKTIAGLAGPTLVAMGITEAINLRAMERNPASLGLVYLNGTLLFVAGVAILRVHNRWSRRWPVIVTLTGWFIAVTGVARMIAPGSTTSGSNLVYALLAVMIAVGSFLTLQGYRREPGETTR